MSQEQNKFDQLIQEKFAAKDFPFDEENWEKAEAQMDRDKNRKRFLWISAVFLFGLMAGVGIMIPFINSNAPSENKMIVQVESRQKAMDQIVNSQKENEKIEVKKDNSDKNSTTVQKSSSALISADKPAKEKKNVQYYSTDQSAPVPDHQNNKVQIKIKDPIISADDQPITSAPKNSPIELAPIQHTKRSDSIPLAEINDADNKTTYGLIKLDSADIKKIDPENNSVPVFPKKDSTPALTQNIPADSVGISHPTAVEPSSAPQPQKIGSSTIYSIDAGTNYVFGWNYGKDTMKQEGQGFNPIFGFGVTHYLNTKWSFNTGIQYGSIAHLNSEKIFSTVKGDFGMTRTDTIIATKWIHYAVVPIFLHYTLNDKNSIGLGGSIGYLVNTTSDYMTSIQSDFKQSVQTKWRSSGFTDGFGKINATCGIAYRRRITDKICLTADVHYGLTDIKKDDFFGKQKVERSSGINFMISYSIFNHK